MIGWKAALRRPIPTLRQIITPASRIKGAEHSDRSRPHTPSMDAWCAPGMRVEVSLTEEGLFGSRYAATVIELGKGKAYVEFEVRGRPAPKALI